VNNQKVEMYLCEQCAREKGAYGEFAIPLGVGNFFASFLGFGDGSSGSKPYIKGFKDVLKCNKCGMTIEEFQGTGKLGCSACYDTFGENLKPLIRRLHGSLEHTGKIPSRLSRGVSITREIARLKELLNKAIEREEYEKAAEIRDKIKSLEVSMQ
jgi:protein arginine kinase activator